jgi:hypothetical protein
MTTVLASAADARYGDWLLNMVGSVKRNSDVFDRIVVYDLGLTGFQRRLLSHVRGADLDTVPPFVPHWREGRTWKPWIWTHADADTLIWLDAGLSVLRPLDEPLAAIAKDGYFVVSQGHPVSISSPPEYYDLVGVSRDVGRRTTVAAGILGFARSGSFYRDVIEPTYADCVRGLSVGFSPGDAERLNMGLDSSQAPVIRDCTHFRWDQTVLNLHLYKAVDDPVVHDLERFAGHVSSREHPEQVIWSHRRRGDLGYLPHVPYRGRERVVGPAWGLWHRAWWWKQNHSWLFRPATYVRKTKQLVARR